MSRRALVLALTIALLSAGCGRLEPISTEEALDRLTVATSKVYDASGEVIANLHGEINREILELHQMPQHLRDAVVAIEDERFWQHQGLDLRSIIRAATRNVQDDEGELQGGSTISQQLAKNIYFGPRPELSREESFLPARTLSRKISEARVTWQLENAYTKREILEMYLNTVYLGRGTYGVETASRSYFGIPTADLSLEQSAFLVGLIHEPARYEWSPSDPPQRRESRIEAGTARRNHVLGRMHKLGMIDADEAEDAKDEPLEVEPLSEQRWKYPYFVDLVLRQLGVLRNSRTQGLDPRFDFLGTSAEDRARNVYLRGLRIYTTLDPKAQEAAERSIEENLPSELLKMNAALASIEPSNGYIRALVGGRDYYPACEEDEPDAGTPLCELAKLNLALGDYGGGSGRQPGSSFKPLVLATALQRGISLHQSYSGSPFVHQIPYSESWTVRNYEGSGGGSMPLTTATARSVNAVFAHLLIDGVGDGDALEGAARVAETSRRLGINFGTPEQYRRRCGDDYLKHDGCIPADNVPAIALGAREVSPLDMASAYSAFANDGMRVEPTAIVRIEDAQGRRLYQADPSRLQAIPVATARGVTHALRGVLRGGTGTAAAIDRPAAGKTGTSQQWRDAWFAGYTPELAAVIWVGNPRPVPGGGTESMLPSNGYPQRVTGGSFPARIWHDYMTSALEDVPERDFRPPPQAIFRGGTLSAAPSPTPTGSPSDSDAPAGNVPSVIGLSYGDAARTLRNQGFRPNTVRSCDPSGNSGLHDVFSQNPQGGEASQGSTVTVFYQGGGCD